MTAARCATLRSLINLHHGDFRDPDTGLSRWGEVDHIAVDPPYGKRNHDGQKHGRRTGTGQHRLSESGDLGYEHWSPADVRAFVDIAAPLCPGWFLAMTSHDLIPAYEEALEAHGRYVFAPVPIITPGMNVRLAGDGPSNWAVYMVVSRRREGRKCWGTKPGYYPGTRTSNRSRLDVKGGKSVALMEAILRDYTDPGDVVCDPCMGGGTTGVAAVRLGRHFVGWEISDVRFRVAKRRLKAARPQLSMFDRPPTITGEQQDLVPHG